MPPLVMTSLIRIVTVKQHRRRWSAASPGGVWFSGMSHTPCWCDGCAKFRTETLSCVHMNVAWNYYHSFIVPRSKRFNGLRVPAWTAVLICACLADITNVQFYGRCATATWELFHIQPADIWIRSAASPDKRAGIQMRHHIADYDWKDTNDTRALIPLIRITPLPGIQNGQRIAEYNWLLSLWRSLELKTFDPRTSINWGTDGHVRYTSRPFNWYPFVMLTSWMGQV